MIRKLEKDNIDFEKKIEELAILEKNIFGEFAYSLESIKDFFKNSDERYRIYIAFVSGEVCEPKIVAYLIALDNLDSYDILKIAAKEEYRGKNIANKLVKKIVEKDIFLEVRESNLRAIKFYEKNNFIKISERKNYYSDNNENAFIMLRRQGNE